jgi:hypothetical protein
MPFGTVCKLTATRRDNPGYQAKILDQVVAVSMFSASVIIWLMTLMTSEDA